MGKIAWIGVIAAMTMAGTAWSAPETSALIAEAQGALDRGDAQHAALLAEAALKGRAVSPVQRGRSFLYRGLAEELLGLTDAAMSDFTTVLDSRTLPAGVQAQALLQRGFLRDGLGHLDAAAKDYSAVIALKGDSLATALNNRANIYRRQNKFADAARDYQAALSANGGKPLYSWYGLGQIAEARADMVSARGFYAKAVAADPGYVLASARLDALGGPADGTVADSQNRIALHLPSTASPAKAVTQAASAGSGIIALRAPQNPSAQTAPVALHPPRREAQNQNGLLSDASLRRVSSADRLVLRPALDQPGRALRVSAAKQRGMEVQLGAWRSQDEANAGWDEARLRAGRALDGISPHIVTADLPGKGRYYRLRINVTAGQNGMVFCADLSARGVTCLPARD
ncbi:MAG TPA: tetratricopeptide repeat protein [Rhizomicrobium sp.]|nr:tetratricopeptide repeat protein [Rhizomicrobium sp.]